MSNKISPYSISRAEIEAASKILTDESKLPSLSLPTFSFYAPHKDVIEESRKSQPLKGHPFHKKSDSELHYIRRDASEAAQAMRGHNPEAELKYLDQVNDAETVLHHRMHGGKRLKEAMTETVDLSDPDKAVRKSALSKIKSYADAEKGKKDSRQFLKQHIQKLRMARKQK
jgi:hypothetical protein